jgi:hypothetical protein
MRLGCLCLAIFAASAWPAAAGPELSLDCTQTEAKCPELQIAGIGPARLPDGTLSPRRGFGDPVLRAEPGTNRVWLAYMWLAAGLVNRSDGKPGVQIDIRYARSNDAGRNWRDLGILWRSVAGANLGGGYATGRFLQEAPNFVHYATQRASGWYGAHLSYFVPDGGAPDTKSYRIMLSNAKSIPQLAQAQQEALGGSVTAAGWNAVNLSALSPDTASCAFWSEPALYAHKSTLYLALRCVNFAGTPETRDTPVMVFAAPIAADVRKLAWRYLGRLAGAAESHELGGVSFTKGELAESRDGKLLLVVSPDTPGSHTPGGVDELGCRALEIASLDRPALARDVKGALIVRASVTASDEAAGLHGCGYDAHSETGIVAVRFDIAPGSTVISMHATGLRP